MNKNKWFFTAAMCALLMTLTPNGAIPARADDSRFFPPTGHTVKGTFLTYWNDHGGLAQQGYPISEELQEQSDTDGKVYTVQYFERAVFEHHPEFAGTPNEVLLSLLGVFYYKDKYPGGAPGQHTSTDNPRLFAETGFTVGGIFRQYWEAHGGLAQQGLPLSNEFQEVSPTDGKTYTVQYFERAVFELHPENNPPYNVLLSLLGVFFYDKRHGGASPTATPATPAPTSTPAATGTVAPTSTATPTSTPTATETPAPQPVGSVGKVLFYNKSTGASMLALVDSQGSLFPQNDSFDFGPGWTHGVSANGDNEVVLFYNSDTGAAITYPLPGSAGDKKTYGFGPGFTSVAPLGGSDAGDVLFYNTTAGGMMLGKVLPEGTFTYVKQNIPWSIGWSNFVGGSNGPVLGYIKFNGDGVTYNVNSNGTLVELKSYTTFSRSWTDITPANHGILIFSRSDGADVATGLIQFTGDFSTLQSYAFVPDPSRGWSNVAAMGNDEVLFYDTVAGIVITMTLDGNGVLSQQKVLRIDPGWTQAIGIR